MIERKMVFREQAKDKIVQCENRFRLFQRWQQMLGRVKEVHAWQYAVE